MNLRRAENGTSVERFSPFLMHADVDPLGEGLSARLCRQRASECDEASNFTTMCFVVVRLSPSIHLLDVRQLPQITPSHFLLGRGAETLMQVNCESRRS